MPFEFHGKFIGRDMMLFVSRSRSSDEFIVQRSVGRRSKYDLPPSRDHHVSSKH